MISVVPNAVKGFYWRMLAVGSTCVGSWIVNCCFYGNYLLTRASGCEAAKTYKGLSHSYMAVTQINIMSRAMCMV